MKDKVLLKYLINSHFLCIDEGEYETNFTEDMVKNKEKLKLMLDEEQMKEVNHYKYKIVGHMFNIRDIECFKMLYLGIKLGMEVEKFCAEEFKEE